MRNRNPAKRQIAIGSSVRIRSTSQNGRVISLKGATATVRLSLDKDVPGVDWIKVQLDDVELIEASATVASRVG